MATNQREEDKQALASALRKGTDLLQCVALCCSVLQRVTTCYSLSLCASGYCTVLWGVQICCRVMQCASVCCSVCSVLQCVAVCCSVLQCVAVCCTMLQCVAVELSGRGLYTFRGWMIHLFTKCGCGSYTFIHKNTLYTATHCNTLQHTATHCNTLQHTFIHKNTSYVCGCWSYIMWLGVMYIYGVGVVHTHLNTRMYMFIHTNMVWMRIILFL